MASRMSFLFLATSALIKLRSSAIVCMRSLYPAMVLSKSTPIIQPLAGAFIGDGAARADCATRLLQAQALHALDVVVAVVCHRIGNTASLECSDQVSHRILNGVAWAEAELALDFARRHVIRAVFIGRRGDDLHVLADHAFDHVGDLTHLMVVVSDVVDLAIDSRVGPLQTLDLYLNHVLYVDAFAHLL